MNKIISFLGYIIIGFFLFDISFVNIEKIVALDISDIYVFIFLQFFIFSIIFRIIGKIFYKKNSTEGFNPLKYIEFQYIVQFILFTCILLLPGFFINHHFLAENLGESNLYLRVYGKLAMGYFAMALIVSPILEFVKNPIWREHLILSRKILGILSFIFFLKHGLEYFAMEYIFQTNYHFETPYLNYVIDNLLVRYDALSGVVAGILLLVLGLTSNKFSQKFLGGKKWKKVQSLVFPAFLLSAVHVAFTSRFEEFYIFLIGLVVITRLVSYLNRKQRRSSGRIIGYRCIPCGYIYDEKIGDLDSGIAPGTKFEDIADDWKCPVCGVTKEDFEPIYEGDEISEKAEIVGYKMLTDDVLELNLKVSNLEKIEVDPGQFANIGFGEFSRSYSVVEVEKNILTFGIRLKDDGKGSEVLKKSKIGDILKFEGIFGNFILQNTNNPKVFIATGTGLSPMINMINNEKNIKGLKPSVDRNLLFGVAYEKDLFYLDKIKKIKNLKSRIYISREEVEGYEYGRISLKEYNFPKDTEFYICGNPKMVQTNIDYLQNNGFKNIYYEKFN